MAGNRGLEPMDFIRTSAVKLEVVIRDAICEAQNRPDMHDFLKTMLGDVLHEMRIEEFAREKTAASHALLEFMSQ